MKSIKTRLVGNFMLLIVVTIAILEILLLNAVKYYYYNNIEDILTNQIKISSDFYSRYFSSSTLQENLIDNVDVFWEQTPAEVQIADTDGNVLMDSIGVLPKEKIQTEDFKKALKGSKGLWVGSVNYDKYKVMTVSYPLRSNDKIIGVLRFTSSLKDVEKLIEKVTIVFIAAGIIVIILAGLLGVFLSNTIIEPLKEVTDSAQKMAGGNFTARVPRKYDDEIGKLSDTLNYMADEVLKREQLKNEFISSVSHELRTPLTSIRGWAITLKSGDLSDKAMISDGLNIIDEESERLSGMVEELLDFSKLISGKTTLKIQQYNIIDIINKVQKQVTPRAERENINFIVSYDPNLPYINIDKNRIIQVLINVLDNAFKFVGENAKVTFTATYNNSYIIIVIEDNGCGISKEELPRIKEKFYKGKSSKSQNGIGLSICDEIISQHNGILQIDSELNVGTKVTICLPLEN